MDLVLDGELDDVYICIVADLYVNLILLNLFTRIYMYIYDICVERDQGLCVVRCSHGERDIYIERERQAYDKYMNEAFRRRLRGEPH